MILEQHYDDAVLIAFLGDEPAARRDPHLISCHPCAETLSALRTMAAALEDETVWELRELDDTPRQSTIDTLRAKQRELAGEDAARTRLRVMLTNPRETWATILTDNESWQTAALVHTFVAEAEKLIWVDPSAAIELARLAVDVARILKDPQALIAALREYAYTLYFTGQYAAALDTTRESERVIFESGAPEVDLARTRLQQALLLADSGKDDEALRLSELAAAVFAGAKDEQRYVAAVRTQAIALHHMRRNTEAIERYHSVFELCSRLDRTAFAGLLQNMALCYREIRDFANATKFFLQALDAYQRLGSNVGIAKTRWHLGRMFLSQGKASEALSLLTEVCDEFQQLSMVQDVALVTIDVAQALMVLGKNSDVAAPCQRALEFFTSVNMLNTEGARTAIALIRESAVTGQLSEEIIVRARQRAEKKMLFAPAFD